MYVRVLSIPRRFLMQRISAASDRPSSPHIASVLRSTAAKENRFVRPFCEGLGGGVGWGSGEFGRRAAGWPWTQLQSQWSERSGHCIFLIPNELALETTQLLLYQFRLFCFLSPAEGASDSAVCRLLAQDQRPFFSLLLSLFLKFLCWKTSVTWWVWQPQKCPLAISKILKKRSLSILNVSITRVDCWQCWQHWEHDKRCKASWRRCIWVSYKN